MAIYDIFIKFRDPYSAKTLYDNIARSFGEMIFLSMSPGADSIGFDSKNANIAFQDTTQELLIDVLKFEISENFSPDGIIQIEYGNDIEIKNPYIIDTL